MAAELSVVLDLPSSASPRKAAPSPLLISTSSAVPVEHTILDSTLFNQALYTRLISFWFSGLDKTATCANAELMRRWLRHGASEAQAAAFDADCQEHFGGVVEAIGPENILLPEFVGYSAEKSQAERIARPFLAEIYKAETLGRKHAINTLLALILLLDQIPRNLYRTPKGLHRVYNHYDRLAFALLHAGLALSAPWSSDANRSQPVYRSWLLVPLLHAEDLASQILLYKLLQQNKADMIAARDKAGERFATNRLEAARRHLEIVYKFGRFPHRNEGLGRKDTIEERTWLIKGGETFGVKQIRLSPRL